MNTEIRADRVSLARRGGGKRIVIHNIGIEPQPAKRVNTDGRLLSFVAQTRITPTFLNPGML